MRRRSSAGGLTSPAHTRRSSSAGLARRSTVERTGVSGSASSLCNGNVTVSSAVSYGGAALAPRLEDERLAEQIGEVVLEWTERALEAVLEAYHGIASSSHVPTHTFGVIIIFW